MILSLQNITLHLSIFFIGFLLFKEFCESLPDEQVPQLKFYEEVISLVNFASESEIHFSSEE